MSERRQRTPQMPRLHWTMLGLCAAVGLGVGLVLMAVGR